MIKKIAVLRANALGDLVFVLPALQALRNHYPQAEIVYLGKQWHKEYLSSRPSPVDRVVIVPPYPGVGEPEDFIPDSNVVNNFFKSMQHERFDIAFQMHGGGKNSNPFLLKLGAKKTIGLRAKEAVRLDISVSYVYYFPEILRYIEVVGKVGIKEFSLEPVITVTERDLEEVCPFLKNTTKPIAVIHPGASDLKRRWMASNFVSIANYLTVQGYEVLLTGSADEKGIVNDILQGVKPQKSVRSVCGQLSLGGLTGLLSSARLVISNDTGPLHLARGLKKPTVGIYWCGNAINGGFTSTNAHRSLLSWVVHCPLCGMHTDLLNEHESTCRHDTSFVEGVKVQQVMQAIRELKTARN